MRNPLAVLEVEAPAPLVELSRDRHLDSVADLRVQLLRQLRGDALHRHCTRYGRARRMEARP